MCRLRHGRQASRRELVDVMWVDGLGEGQLTESGVVAAWGVVQLVGQVTGRSSLVLLGNGMGLLLWAKKWVSF